MAAPITYYHDDSERSLEVSNEIHNMMDSLGRTIQSQGFTQISSLTVSRNSQGYIRATVKSTTHFSFVPRQNR